MSYFIVTGFDWERGQIVSNEVFDQGPHKTFFVKEVPPDLGSTPDYMARRNTELGLEKCRVERFPSKASRRRALFLSETIDAAKKWTGMNKARSGYGIYELSVVHEENSAAANYLWYNYCVRLHKDLATEFLRIFVGDPKLEIDRCMEAYWKNEPSEPFGSPSHTEILFIGRLEVVQKIV